MQSTRPPDELYKPYPYEYRYYRKEIPYADVQKNVKIQRQSQIYKHGDAESETVYNYKTNTETKAVDVEEENYGQPTLPYYVVPVLYVPKRVLPNDETQAAQLPPATQNKTTSYYTKSCDDIEDRYEQYRNYYSQYYARRANMEAAANISNASAVEDMSYYNVQYSGSSTSIKDEVLPHSYSRRCSYTFMPKSNMEMENIRNLRSQLACPSQEYPKMTPKTRSAYECTQRKSRQNLNSYYYPTHKEHYYESVDPQRYDYYSYPPEIPQHYNRFENYKTNLSKISKIENKPTRIVGTPRTTDKEVGKPKEDIQANQKIIDEKQRPLPIKQTLRTIIDRGTQTTDYKVVTGTVSTQTEFADKKTMIPLCKPKVQIENVYSDEEDKMLAESSMKPKEPRRSLSLKRPTTAFQSAEQQPHPRMQSPVRRLRKL